MERSWQVEREYQRKEKRAVNDPKGTRSRLWYTAAALGVLAATAALYSLWPGWHHLPSSQSNLMVGELAAVKATDQGLTGDWANETTLSKFFQGLLKKYQLQQGEKGPVDTWSSRPLTIFFTMGQGEEEAEMAVLLTKITSRLQESPRITVLERDQLEVILQELALSASNLADSDSALRLGELLSGTLFSTCSLYRVDSGLQVILRLVENETTVIKAAFCEEWASETSVETMADRLSQKIFQALDKHFPLRGKIKTVVNYDRVIVNIGAKHGLKSGTKLKVIKDQKIYQNGEIIGEENPQVGEIEVSEVKTDYSYAKVLGRSEDLTAGMKVIP